MTSPNDDPDINRRRSLRLQGADPVFANDRDDNPPPPGESHIDLSQSLLSLPPLPDDAFTTVERTHEGRPTTSPRDAIPRTIVAPPVHLQNQFAHLGQDDADTTVSGDIIGTRFSGIGEDAASTSSPTIRTLTDIARATDATIAEINAIPTSSPVFSDDLHRLEQSITSKFSSDLGVMGETMSSLFATLNESLAHTTKELIANITQINSNMTLFKERVERDHQSVTAAITTLSGNTARLSEETTALSVRVIEHQDHLENLLGFEEARRAQMDDHWRSIVDITAAVDEVKTTATTQTDRITAQLNGIRANTESTTTALRNDVNDLRGRIIPSIRDQANALADSVQRLENKVEQSTALADSVQRLENKFNAFSNRQPATMPISTPDSRTATQPLRDLPDEVPQDHDRPTTETSWYTRPTSARLDDPAVRSRERPHPVSTAPLDEPEGPLFLGGRITTPRSTDKERQARLLNISRHDIANLACSDYHGGPAGVKELTLQFIHACGYQSFATTECADDILPCYGQIQLLHKKVRQAWYNPRTLVSGPSVDRILEKGLVVLPKLRDPDAKGTVAFYERLQQVSAAYLIPLMPFDAICLRNNYEGLFPPGLGTDAYTECCAAVLEVLPRLLPMTNTEVSALVSAVSNASRNGYDLLWRVLELYVPGFDPTVPIAQPLWTRDSTILDFCQSHLLYFRLQAKKHVFFSARDRTNIFLRAVAPSEYADVVTTIMTSVDTYRHPDDDGHLPDQFRLNEIAMLIHNNAKHRIRDVHTPRIHRVAAIDQHFDDSDDDASTDPHLLIQGFTPRANRVDRQGDRNVSGPRQNNVRFAGDRYGDRGNGNRFGDQAGERYGDRGNGNRFGDHGKGQSTPTSQGRYTRPDQRRRPFKPGVQCAACKRIGHEAANCDMLAIALFIDRYTKQDLNPSDKDRLEQQWLTRWKDKLGMPARTPRQVMRTYCDINNITEDFLAEAMDWECWPESEPPDDDSN